MEMMIRDYRDKIKSHMRFREYKELEQILRYLTGPKLAETKFNVDMLKELRLDIIHG